MTVSNSKFLEWFPYDRSQEQYHFEFPIAGEKQIDVFLEKKEQFRDRLVYGDDYVVHPNIPNDFSRGGYIKMLKEFTEQKDLYIYIIRDTNIIQPYDFIGTGILPPARLQHAIDRLTEIAQEQRQNTTKLSAEAITTPISDPDDINTVLPPANQRANKSLIFDKDGNVTTAMMDKLNYRGEYTSGTAYHRHDLISSEHHNKVYIAVKDYISVSIDRDLKEGNIKLFADFDFSSSSTRFFNSFDDLYNWTEALYKDTAVVINPLSFCTATTDHPQSKDDWNIRKVSLNKYIQHQNFKQGQIPKITSEDPATIGNGYDVGASGHNIPQLADNGKLPSSVVPHISFGDTQVFKYDKSKASATCPTEWAKQWTDAVHGDIAVVVWWETKANAAEEVSTFWVCTDESKLGSIDAWTEYKVETGVVTINGKQGHNVHLTTSDIPEGDKHYFTNSHLKNAKAFNNLSNTVSNHGNTLQDHESEIKKKAARTYVDQNFLTKQDVDDEINNNKKVTNNESRSQDNKSRSTQNNNTLENFKGGSTGQVAVKQSGKNYDIIWKDISQIPTSQGGANQQTVMSGPVDNNGRADFLKPNGGLSVTTKNITNTPLIATIGNGFYDNPDYTFQLQKDLSVNNLTDNMTNYLYLELDDNENVHLKASTSAPYYGMHRPIPEYEHWLCKNSYTFGPFPFSVISSGKHSNKHRPWYCKRRDNHSWLSQKNSYHSSKGDSWLGTDFKRPVRVVKYQICSRRDNNEKDSWPQKWHLQGSHDNKNWDDIQLYQKMDSWKYRHLYSFNVKPENQKSYRYWRIKVYRNRGGDYTAIGRLRFKHIRDNVYWYPIDHRQCGEYFDESTRQWKKTLRVYIGEAEAKDGKIQSCISYAYQGKYHGVQRVIGQHGHRYNIQHNIGVNGQEGLLNVRGVYNRIWKAGRGDYWHGNKGCHQGESGYDFTIGGQSNNKHGTNLQHWRLNSLRILAGNGSIYQGTWNHKAWFKKGYLTLSITRSF